MIFFRGSLIKDLNIDREKVKVDINKLENEIKSMEDRLAHLNNLNQLKAYYEKKIDTITEEKKIEIIKDLVYSIIIEKNGNVIIKFKFEKDDNDDTWNGPIKEKPAFMQDDFVGEKSGMLSTTLPKKII